MSTTSLIQSRINRRKQSYTNRLTQVKHLKSTTSKEVKEKFIKLVMEENQLHHLINELEVVLNIIENPYS